MRLPFLAILLAAGCGPDDATRSARAYVEQLEPLLYENGLLAERLLLAAADAHDDRVAPTALHTTWTTDLRPLAEHLAWQAAATSPPPEWAGRHERLVAAWSDRATAYRLIDEAARAGDREEWRRAREQADRATIAEERWFSEMDVELAPYGLALDQYP
jgi:hypothetical protein